MSQLLTKHFIVSSMPFSLALYACDVRIVIVRYILHQPYPKPTNKQTKNSKKWCKCSQIASTPLDFVLKLWNRIIAVVQLLLSVVRLLKNLFGFISTNWFSRAHGVWGKCVRLWDVCEMIRSGICDWTLMYFTISAKQKKPKSTEMCSCVFARQMVNCHLRLCFFWKTTSGNYMLQNKKK